MIDCLIMGDSIAVGTAAVKEMRICQSYSKGGINTWQFNKMYAKDFSAEVVIISLGSNDHKYIKTESELLKIRSRVTAQRVYWVLPAGNLKASQVDIKDVQRIIKQIAEKNGDVVLPIKKLQPDGIHPSSAGYREIAEQVR